MGEKDWKGTRRGLPACDCLDVAQINSPPISFWPNLEPDQTRNSTAVGVEPGLMLHKPAPPLQSPSHSQSPITLSRHALWLRGGSLMLPRPEGASAPLTAAPWQAAHCLCAQEGWELDP